MKRWVKYLAFFALLVPFSLTALRPMPKLTPDVNIILHKLFFQMAKCLDDIMNTVC